MKIQQLLFKLLRKQNVTDVRTHGRTDNVKTVYPTTNKVCGGGGGGGRIIRGFLQLFPSVIKEPFALFHHSKLNIFNCFRAMIHCINLVSSVLNTIEAQTSMRTHAVWSAPLLFDYWKYYIETCYNWIYNFLSIPFSWGDWFESQYVKNTEVEYVARWGLHVSLKMCKDHWHLLWVNEYGFQ